MLFLPDVPQCEWRTPSQAMRRDHFGHEVRRVRFRLRALRDDGHVGWIGWFDSREDADAFLWAIAIERLPYERELWDLPNETWTPQEGFGNLGWRPDFWEGFRYDFVTQRNLTSTSGSNQTDPVPTDWNSSNNIIDVIAGGGSGAAGQSSRARATGGTGGGCSRSDNVVLTPGGSATFKIGANAAGVVSTGINTGSAGNNGADCWYNGTTLGGSSVGARGGSGGQFAINAGTSNGVANDNSTNGVGSVFRRNGGQGGNATTSVSRCTTGGGGAAGSTNNGTAGGNGTDTATAGGAGDGGLGGGGGAGNTNGNGTAGSAGSEYGGFGGSGGGGGGGGVATGAGTPVGAAGGSYGAGGGAVVNAISITGSSGVGIQGLIYMEYTPGKGPIFRRSTRFFTRAW